MLRLRNATSMPCVVLWGVCWLGNTSDVSAQERQMLVVVTDASDEEPFKRIGNSLFEVQVLLLPKSGQESDDYRVCNDRVHALRDFRYLFYRENAECSADRFWRQRLAAANPEGESLRLSQSRPVSDIAQSADRAKAVHRALLAKFPSQRKQLDANLRSELHRLYLRSVPPLQLASHN